MAGGKVWRVARMWPGGRNKHGSDQRSAGIFGHKEISQVMEHYDVGFYRCGRIICGRGSVNVVLDTSKGRMLLKRYLHIDSGIDAEHFVLEEVIQQGFPCPFIIKTVEGCTAYRTKESCYALYRFMEGEAGTHYVGSREREREIARLAGRTLAGLHNILAEIDKSRFPERQDDVSCLWERGEHASLRIVEEYERSVMEGAWFSRRRVKQMLEDIRRYIGMAFRFRQEKRHILPEQIIHYDYAPKNIIISNGNVVSVLDFGEVRVDFRASDMARAVTSFGGRFGGKRSRPWIYSALLEGYNDVGAVGDEELKALPELLLWRELGIVLQTAACAAGPSSKAGESAPNVRARRSIERKLGYMRRLEYSGSEMVASYIG